MVHVHIDVQCRLHVYTCLLTYFRHLFNILQKDSRILVSSAATFMGWMIAYGVCVGQEQEMQVCIYSILPVLIVTYIHVCTCID